MNARPTARALSEMAALAQRWARCQDALSKPGPVVRVVVADVLSADESERLYAWVRDWLDGSTADIWAPVELAEDLGITQEQAALLGEAAGWE